MIKSLIQTYKDLKDALNNNMRTIQTVDTDLPHYRRLTKTRKELMDRITELEKEYPELLV